MLSQTLCVTLNISRHNVKLELATNRRKLLCLNSSDQLSKAELEAKYRRQDGKRKEAREFLSQSSTLEELAHQTLRERAVFVSRKFKLKPKLSESRLARFYRSQGTRKKIIVLKKKK